jgi:DNA-binding transcriptional LysR family regulator
MEWQQLRAFRHLARTGSFSQAARATLRTQPAVSQQIKALEDELGCTVVERSGRRFRRLTPAGRRLLAFCDLVQREEQALREDLAALRGRTVGRLRLAAPLTTLVQLLPPVLRRYAAQYPDVELTLWDRPQDEVVAMVRAGEADLGLALGSAAPASLEARPWKQVHPALMTPRGHPLARRRKPPSLEDLAGYRLILPPASQAPSHRKALEELFSAQGVRCQVLLESANAELSAALVEQGLGLAFASVVEGGPAGSHGDLAFVPLDHLLPSDFIALLHRRDRRPPGYQRALVDMLLNQP